MGISTRSKTGSLPPVTPITKPTVTSRKAKAKANKTSTPTNGDATPTSATLPDIKLMSDTGNHVTTLSLLSEQTPALFLFTYPRANTGGCTTQATGLNGLFEQAKKVGYNIAGCSYDSVKSQAGWKAKHSMKFALLSDTLDAGLLKKLGAHKAPKSVKRSLFIIKKENDVPSIVEKKINISPKDCVAFVTQYIKDHPVIDQEKEDEKKEKERTTEKKEEETKESQDKPAEESKDDKKDNPTQDTSNHVVSDTKASAGETMKDV